MPRQDHLVPEVLRDDCEDDSLRARAVDGHEKLGEAANVHWLVVSRDEQAVKGRIHAKAVAFNKQVANDGLGGPCVRACCGIKVFIFMVKAVGVHGERRRRLARAGKCVAVKENDVICARIPWPPF